jgi:hypothetical protein
MKETIEVPRGAIFVQGSVFCPERFCGAQLILRKQDGLRYCGYCMWNYQESLLTVEEKERMYKRPTTTITSTSNI